MAFKPTTPYQTNKVTYFKHFPHYFLRPYDAQLLYNQQEFLEKLSPKNCEWLTRPKVAVSEMAEALTKNWEIIQTSTIFDDSVRSQLESIISPIMQNLINLDNKEKSTTPTEQDIYQVLHSSFQNTDLDHSLSQMMQASSAMYVFLTQLRAMRGLVTNPQIFSTKLVNDAPDAQHFKNTKTVASMQQMLTAMTVSSSTTAATMGNVTALAGQLVNPSAGGPSATALQLPTAPVILQPPTTALIQPPNPPPQDSPGVTNQLMDMILQLQNQMQQMQQQNQVLQRNEATSSVATTSKKRKRQQETAPVLPEEIEEPEDEKSVNTGAAQNSTPMEQVQQPKAHKHKKKKRSSK